MSRTMPGLPYRFDDGKEIPRRPITEGSIVTGEDPAASLYGGRYRVIEITEDGRAVLLGAVGERTRREIRDVRDTPHSAQIGWPRTVWDRSDDGGEQ